MILAGQGVLYAEASDELVKLAELLQAPVMTTVDGKSAFPENHALSLGSGGNTFTGPGRLFLYTKADLILGIGTGLNRHPLTTPPLPKGVPIIHAVNDTRDLHKQHQTEVALLGDAKLVLAQLVEAVKDRLGGKLPNASPAAEIAAERAAWLARWEAKLRSKETPDHTVSRDVGVHPRGRSSGCDRDPRLRQPARPVAAVLLRDPAARVPRVGQVASVGHRSWSGDRRQGRRAGQVLCQLHG